MTRYLTDILFHGDLGGRGNGFSDISFWDMIKTSFSSCPGLNIGADETLSRSNGTTSRPSSIVAETDLLDVELELTRS